MLRDPELNAQAINENRGGFIPKMEGQVDVRTPGAPDLEPGSFRDPESRVFYAGDDVFRALSPDGLFVFTTHGPHLLAPDFTVLGSLIAILLLLIGKTVALPGVLNRLNTSTDVQAWPFTTISLIILVAGLTIGAVGSGLTIRRFLRVSKPQRKLAVRSRHLVVPFVCFHHALDQVVANDITLVNPASWTQIDQYISSELFVLAALEDKGQLGTLMRDCGAVKGAIEKAIRNADLGLNPANDGKIVRIPIPPLTEERRKDLVKRAHHIAEEARTAIRQVRRDGNDKLKKMLKNHEVSEEDVQRALEEIQKMTDKHIDEVANLLNGKEHDIMAV